MDRLPQTLVACSLGLLLAAPGCRSTRDEVPPGRPFANDGRQRKPIEFSSEGHPVNGMATAKFQPDMTPNRSPQAGVASGRDGGSSPFGALPGPAYGAPGTSGLGEPPSPSVPGSLGEPPSLGAPPAEAGPSAAPALNVEPPSHSQTVAPSLDAPGAMGRPGDLPSPN